jgi:hypothetical protein
VTDLRSRAQRGRIAGLLGYGDRFFGIDSGWSPRWTAIVVYVALGAAGFVVALLRIPSRSLELLWAEDAGVFLEAAYVLPVGEAIGTGYAGYAHLVPRVIAAACAAWIPIDQIPIATSVIMAALTSALGLAVFFFSRAHVSSPVARGLAWVLVVAAPVAGLEIALSTANFQWYLLLGGFWAVFGRRPGVTSVVASTLILVCAIGSSAIALLFVPFAVWRALRFRTVADAIPAGGAVAAAIFQLVVVFTSSRERGGRSLNPFNFVGNYAVEVVGGTWVGPQVVFWSYAAAPLLVLLLTVALTIVTYALAWRMRFRQPLGILALGFGGVYLVPVMWLTATAGPFLAGLFNQGATGSRYLFPAIAVTGLVLVALVDDLLARRGRSAIPLRNRMIVVVVILIQLVAVVIGFRGADPRHAFLGGLPTWSDALVIAREGCEADPGDSQFLRGGPDSVNEWDSLEVDCDVLLGR